MPEPSERFSFLGLEFPISKLGGQLLSLVAVAGVALFLYNSQWRQPELRVLTAEQQRAVMKKNMQHYARHMGEKPLVPWMDLLPDLSVAVYKDRCVAKAEVVGGQVRTTLLPSLTDDDDDVKTGWRLELETPVSAQGRCLTPHPGEAQIVDQVYVNPCLMRVTWAWADSCLGVQPFDQCHGWWGPFSWTRCVH